MRASSGCCALRFHRHDFGDDIFVDLFSLVLSFLLLLVHFEPELLLRRKGLVAFAEFSV
jgi:hypothetical protein